MSHPASSRRCSCRLVELSFVMVLVVVSLRMGMQLERSRLQSSSLSQLEDWSMTPQRYKDAPKEVRHQIQREMRTGNMNDGNDDDDDGGGGDNNTGNDDENSGSDDDDNNADDDDDDTNDSETQVDEDALLEAASEAIKIQQIQQNDQSTIRKRNETAKEHHMRNQREKVIPPSEDEQEEEDEEPLNILLLYADDWTMKVLGKLNPYVVTPNMDKLADQGMLFTNNGVTTSMCWISRASMMTGTYASRHLFLEPDQETLFHTHAWGETLFPLLKQGGYYTGLVGKWHAPQPEDKIEQAFDYRNFYFGDHWMERNGKMRHVTDLNVEDSLDFLRHRPAGRPFFLKVSFFATHAWDGNAPHNYVPMNETRAKYYNKQEIPRPKTATEDHWKRLPFFFQEGNEGRNRWHDRFDVKSYQENVKDLFRMATEVDAAIGMIVKELKKQRIYDRTLIVFTTDNGNMHGEHGLAEKWYPFEESIHVPLVIVDPRMKDKDKGTRNNEFTLNIDLAPTLLGAAKIPPSSFMQGRDIADLYLDHDEEEGAPTEKDVSTNTNNNTAITSSSNQNDRKRPWRQDWFYEYNRGDPITAEGHLGAFWIDASFALINKEWKYIYWPHHQYEQIFHRINDPFEEHDLLNSTKIVPSDKVYKALRSRYEELKAWVQSGKHV